MIYKKYDVVVDLVNGVNYKQRRYYNQGDSGTSIIGVTLTNNSMVVPITGQSIIFHFKRSDKSIVSQDMVTGSKGVSIVDEVSGTFQCILDPKVLVVPGEVECQAELSLDGKVLTTATFTFTVFESISGLKLGYIASINDQLAIWRGELDLLIENGVKGLTGNTGAKGDKGDQGIQGIQGIQGLKGDKGDIGNTGVQGTIGVTGIQGVKDDKGDKGDTGAQGVQGIIGVTGNTGNTGAVTYTWIKYGTSSAGAGITDSPVGMTYIGIAVNKPSATKSAVPTDYSWSLIQGPQGIQGVQGIQGIQGVTGTTGTTGGQGIQGVKGDTGAQGIQGIQGIQGVKGTDSIPMSVVTQAQYDALPATKLTNNTMYVITV